SATGHRRGSPPIPIDASPVGRPRRLAIVAANAQPPPVPGIVRVGAACDQLASRDGPVVGHCCRSVAQSTVRFARQHAGPEASLVAPSVPPLAGGGALAVVGVGGTSGLAG